jgi:hydroxymethylpyrimidine pyrophosphatase-like HAD family hydrolase
MQRKKTLIIDIDGTILKHRGSLSQILTEDAELLPKTIDKLKEWDLLGYNIILLTGRKESMRKHTINELEKLGIFYDQLIMGVGGGQRILINDLKDHSDEPTAVCFNLVRNKGVGEIEI